MPPFSRPRIDSGRLGLAAMLTLVGALCSCSTVPQGTSSLGESSTCEKAQAAYTLLAANPADTQASKTYHRAVADLVKWYDALPPDQRESAARAADITVQQDATNETGLHRFMLTSQVPRDLLTRCQVRAGIGVPVVAWRPNDGTGKLDHLRPPEGIFAPMTAVLDRKSTKHGDKWTLRFLWPTDRETITFANRTVPLAADFSAPIAVLIQHAEELRKSGFLGMLNPTTNRVRREKLYLIQPYDPQKIPLIMVHGLQSTPVAFANLVNDLLADPLIRSRYQIWHYHYPTGTPVMWNAMVFRRTLNDTLRKIDPEGNDYATNHLFVIGHSMGGVLTHTLVSDSGYKLWDGVVKVRPDKLHAPPISQQTLEDLFLFRHDPRVKRVIFISVPHRGSAIADNWIGDFGQSLYRADPKLNETLGPLLENHRDVIHPFLVDLAQDGKISSIRTLSGKSPSLMALSGIPPQVPFHSIIGQRKDGPKEKGSDGVVPYTSSHLEGAESELIVKHGHGSFRNEAAVAEIKRILRLHVGAK
jgi:pimeloyl-ACP methyl ester carboxylesterase